MCAPRARATSSDSSDFEIETKVLEELKRHFRPEFLNRVDETIIFQRLSRTDLRGIVDLQVALLQQRLKCGTGFQPVNLTLTLTDAAKDRLAADGFDPVYGARPLKRTIQRELQNPLAGLILEGKVADGDTVQVSADAEGLIINGEAVQADAAA